MQEPDVRDLQRSGHMPQVLARPGGCGRHMQAGGWTAALGRLFFDLLLACGPSPAVCPHRLQSFRFAFTLSTCTISSDAALALSAATVDTAPNAAGHCQALPDQCNTTAWPQSTSTPPHPTPHPGSPAVLRPRLCELSQGNGPLPGLPERQVCRPQDGQVRVLRRVQLRRLQQRQRCVLRRVQAGLQPGAHALW